MGRPLAWIACVWRVVAVARGIIAVTYCPPLLCRSWNHGDKSDGGRHRRLTARWISLSMAADTHGKGGRKETLYGRDTDLEAI
jgi:hypothetical protein